MPALPLSDKPLRIRAFAGKPRQTSAWTWLLSMAATACLLSCSRQSTVPASMPSPDADAVGTTRMQSWLLPHNARAESYHLEITLDPDQPNFRGVSEIDVVLTKPSSVVVLNGRDLAIGKAWALIDGQQIHAHVSQLPGADPRATPDELLLAFDSPLSGKALLHLEFEGTYREDLGGLYRVESGGHYYAFSQFEPMDARSAFPCFDEPDQKVPFQITMLVPKGQLAFTNMNETSRSDEGSWTRFEFAPSPPMPSYLVAFAAGPLEVLQWQAPNDSSQKVAMPSTPTRLITTGGKSDRGKLALQWTTNHLAELEKYFKLPYPYPKLDIVAVPEFAAGAMENAGLVTFREELLLITENSSSRAQRRMSSVVAHELAHMWFGDLVTMRWWDDLWLNEGFATWMSAKVVDKWQPSMEIRLGFLNGVDSAMGQDSRPSARTMQQPVKTQTDAFRSFSGITYAKGASVLSMVEQWVGEASFQSGIQTYLRDNSWKNATSNDLFAALGGSKHPVPEVIASFTTQTGVPSVSFDWQCSEQALKVQLEQESYAPLGLETSEPGKTWKVPVCVRFAEGTQVRKECTLLTESSQAWTIPVSQCPSWLTPNADHSGYYRSALSTPHLTTLAKASALSRREKVGWVLDAGAMFDAGDLLAGDYLNASVQFINAEQRPSSAWSHFLGNVRWLEKSVENETEKLVFQTWLRATLAPELKRLGLEPRPDEPSTDRLLRGTLLVAAGRAAHDSTVLNWAAQLADTWLTAPDSVSAESAAVALPLAGSLGDPTRFTRLLKLALSTDIAEHRTLAWQAAGATTVPEQAQELLQLVVENKISAGDYPYFITSLLTRKKMRSLSYPWLISHFDQLAERIPFFSLRRFVRAAISRCSLDDRQAIEDFFKPRLSKLEGMDGVLKESRERAVHCTALRERNRQSLTTYLKQ